MTNLTFGQQEAVANAETRQRLFGSSANPSRWDLASRAITQEFVAVINTLVDPEQEDVRYLHRTTAGYARTLERYNDAPLHIETNTIFDEDEDLHAIPGFCRAVALNVVTQSKFLRGHTTQNIFVDGAGTAHTQLRLRKRSLSCVYIEDSAIRPATYNEVNNAVNVLAQAVSFDDSLSR
jgi:hypothetical protein